MPDLPSPVELLTDLDRALRARKVRWYVFGAQAVTVYGRPRLTADVDVTVEVEPDDAAKLVEELAARRKDLEDIKGVLQAQADGLDLTYVRSTLTELEQALDRADLHATLDAVNPGL